MKKLISAFLAIILALTLSSCGSEQMSEAKSAPGPYEFSMSINDLSESLDFLSKEPETSSTGEYGNAGTCVGYQYNLGSNAAAVVYVSEAGYIAGFFVTVNIDSDDISLKTAADAMANIVVLFADDVDATSSALFNDFSDGAYSRVSDGLADMTVLVNGSTVIFTATPIT